jgi:hypothetical protein
MLNELSKEFYNKLYNLPPHIKDLEQFATIALNKFIEELVKNQQCVVWNSGCDAVVFVSKGVDGHKSLNQIKEDFLGQASDVRDSDVS